MPPFEPVDPPVSYSSADAFRALRDDRPSTGPLGRSEKAELVDRKSTRLNSSHSQISYAVFCLKKKKKTAGRRAIPAKRLQVTNFSTVFPDRRNPRVRLGRRSFQRLKEPLHHHKLFWSKPALICALHKILDLHCALHYTAAALGAATSRQLSCTPVREGTPMIKVEDIQSYGKEHLQKVAASATTVQNGLPAIATANRDSTKRTFAHTT